MRTLGITVLLSASPIVSRAPRSNLRSGPKVGQPLSLSELQCVVSLGANNV